MLYCVPSSVSSGLANLPLSHIYFNGTKTDKTTTPFLPTGEKLNGRNAYEKLLAFHTTTNMTADEVYALGWKYVNLLYPQVRSSCNGSVIPVTVSRLNYSLKRE